MAARDQEARCWWKIHCKGGYITIRPYSGSTLALTNQFCSSSVPKLETRFYCIFLHTRIQLASTLDLECVSTWDALQDSCIHVSMWLVAVVQCTHAGERSQSDGYCPPKFTHVAARDSQASRRRPRARPPPKCESEATLLILGPDISYFY